MRSLRVELLFIIALAGLVPVILISLILQRSYEKRFIDEKTRSALSDCMAVADQLYQSGYLEGVNDEEIENMLTDMSDMYDGRVMVIDPDLKIIKDTYSLSEGKYYISEEAAQGLAGNASSYYDRDAGFIRMITPIRDRKDDATIGVMSISISTSKLEKVIGYQKTLGTVLIAALSLMILGAAVFVATRIVSRFNTLSGTIENIKEGFGEEEIEAFSYRETAGIKEAFNHLLQRMRNLDDSRSEFVANVSHELKTPITSIKILAESLTAQTDVPNEKYREFMEDIVEEVDREDRIINDLLSLVKMDRAGANLSIEKVDIDQMIEEIIRRLGPIAQKAGVEMVFETIRPVIAEVDETKLSLAITNVIENGIKYNHEGGSVRVTLDSEPAMFSVTVEDTGCGIPEEDIPNIFERFYRVDKSHSREIGGTGLGLAIARGSILMHNGAIRAESTVGEGSRFIIKVPIRREGIV